jgi:hypothetical protein
MIVSVSPRSTGVPLLGVLVPVVGSLVSVIGLAALASPVPVGTVVGAAVVHGRSIYATFLVGFVVLVVAALLPWVGGLVTAAVVVAGLGGWVLSGEESVDGLRSDLPPPIGEHE